MLLYHTVFLWSSNHLQSEFFDKRFQADKITNYINKDAKITSLCEPYYLEEELKKVIKNLPQRRLPGGEFTQEHFDLAASVQDFFQISYKKIVQDAIEESGNSLVTLSGGCALNCLANSELMGAEWLDDETIREAVVRHKDESTDVLLQRLFLDKVSELEGDAIMEVLSRAKKDGRRT